VPSPASIKVPMAMARANAMNKMPVVRVENMTLESFLSIFELCFWIGKDTIKTKFDLRLSVLNPMVSYFLLNK
jgi:hypothetical protein